MKDYGADPIGDGLFRMIPSGDIVSFEERLKRLPPVDMNNKPDFLIGTLTAQQVKGMQGGDLTIDELAEEQSIKPLKDVRALFGTWPDKEDDGFEEAINELRHKGTIKEANYNRILTDRISDTGKRKLKHLKKIAGEGGYYLLEFVEEEEKL